MKIHFMGIKGSGMAGVASLASKMGYKVTGCDLEADGHDVKHLKDIDLLVVTPAVFYQNAKHPELVEGQKRKIVLTWQEFLGKYLQKNKQVICIAGTHGKSTTTAMAGKLLEDAGLDPLVSLGANYKEWQGGARFGKGKYFVTEADEFFDNFLNYHPEIIILNNIEFDHPDYFKSEEAVKQSFKKFINKLVGRKILITQKDSLQKHFNLKILGEHNQQNANLVYVLGKKLGIAEKTIISSIESFEGIERRMELISDKNGIKIYDDYAHHPTAIRATIEALRKKYPKNRLWVVVEAHGYHRTQALLPLYKNVFTEADKVVIGPIFKARDKETFDITPQKIADISGHKDAKAFNELAAMMNYLKDELTFGDVVLVMGAGKSNLWAKEIVDLFQSKEVLLKDFTTSTVGGPARLFKEVKSEKELIEVVKKAKRDSLAYLIIGFGSNLLVSDSGFNGLVIKNSLYGIEVKGSKITVKSGTPLSALVRTTVEKGLSGMEKMLGIPGTVGGGIYGNAGAYGQSVSDHLTRVRVFDGEKILWLTKEDCHFNYRESIFKKKKEMIILEGEFELPKGNLDLLQKESQKVLEERIRKYPAGIKCPGSFFKNLEVSKLTIEQLKKIPKDKIIYGKIPAGYLLEAVGAKGMSLGKIKVSDCHGNLIINTGGGTASDFYKLVQKLKAKVKAKFGIELEPEVQLVGFDLKEKYPKFVYEKYSWKVEKNNLVIKFNFSIPPDINFNPEIIVKNFSSKKFSQLDKKKIDNFIFNLGMIELLSYWKTTCSPEIIIAAGHLDNYQVNWWKELILDGMGQFFFENKINFTPKNFISIKNTGKKVGFVPTAMKSEGILIPVGGGKDSVVTLELLKNEPKIGVFVINPTKASLGIIKKTGIKNVIEVERKIDEKLLELNNQGFLNGHTPFSAVIAFLSVFCADLFGYKEVALSNERSADEENVIYLGKKINHQYSKTLDFENKFREYSKKYLSKVNYFSFLRPIYEIQISKIFSKMDKYFSLIRSCNVGQKTNTWCGQCPKCLSTFILLYPFLGEKKILRVFPENLLKKNELKPILDLLILENKVKPFECVGTREEIRLALKGKSLSGILSSWGRNNLDDKYEKILKKAI